MLAGFTACEQQPDDIDKPNPDNGNEPTTSIVVLNADKDSIVADGTDSVTFEVTVDGKVRTSECQIICLNDNSIVEGATFTTTEADTYEFKAAFGDILSETKSIVATAVADKPGKDDPKVVLTVDKSEIKADGTDVATFTVTVDGEAVTEGYTITNLEDDTTLKGNTFTTDEAGEYRFVAEYEYDGAKIKSNEAKVKAVEDEPVQNDHEVVLDVDKSEIQANNTDVATFTVTVDGDVVTEGYTITNLIYNITLEGNTFTSDVAGDFRFVAEYDGVKSNEVAVTAVAIPAPVIKELKLIATPNRIKSDGIEEAVFTVTYGEEDVTNEAEVFNTADNSVVESKKFSSNEPGTYNFRARYNGETTGVSTTVNVYDPDLVGMYEPCTIYDKDGVKGVIFAINEDNKGDTYVYIMSMDEEDLQWSTENAWCNCATNRGDWNTNDPFDYYGMDINKYPAFKWCKEHGEGWFLPSSSELHLMWNAITDGVRDFDAPKVAEYNKLLTDNGGEPFCETFYWSSNETSEDMVEVVAFMDSSVVCLEPYKDRVYTARAVYRFKLN